MRRILLGIAAAVLLAAPVFAADIPAAAPIGKGPIMMPPASDWTTCYVGGNVGWGRANHDYISAGGLSEGRTTADGVVAGGQAGCDAQVAGYWVLACKG